MFEQQDKLICKAIFVGDTNTGKTCLLNRLSDGTFTETAPTLGTEHKYKKLPLDNNKILNLSFWDTSGQEKYHALNKIYYKDAKIVILVYDITKRKTFDVIQSYWYNEINNLCDNDIVLGLAGNKVDLYAKAEVSEQEGEEYAKSIGAFFMQTSAKENIGIFELVKELSESYYKVKKGKDELQDIKLALAKGKQKKGGCCQSSKSKNKEERITESSTCDSTI